MRLYNIRSLIVVGFLFLVSAFVLSEPAKAVNSGANGPILITGTNSSGGNNSGLFAFPPSNPNALTPISTIPGTSALTYYPAGATPNGQEVAYSRKGSVDGTTYNLFRKNIDGTGSETMMTLLLSPGQAAFYPVYNSTASNLLMTSNFSTGGPWQVQQLDLNTFVPTALTSGSIGSMDADYSPDSSQIVYSDMNTYGPLLGELWTMNANGSNKQLLLDNDNENFWDFAPSWSVNDEIIFSSNRNGGILNIWKINANGTGLQQLTHYSGTVNASRAVVSPDGSKILYIRHNNGIPQLWVMNSDGTGQVQTQAGTLSNIASPSWAPTTATTTITSSPPVLSNNPDPSFSFSANDPTATFECRIDGGAWDTCVSGETFLGLSNGEHTFEVRAINNPGTGGIASYTWEIDADVPEVEITSGPPLITTIPSAVFEFESDDPTATFECALDEGPFIECDSPQAYFSLSEGEHTFYVKAINSLGTESAVDSYTWTTDYTPPVITITQGPAEDETINDDSPVFEFESNKPNTTFECRIGSNWLSEGTVDWGMYETCDSGLYQPGPLADGKYTIEILATDEAGNSSAVFRQFEIDTTPPEVTILTHPPVLTNNPDATFTFEANEDNVDFECRLNGGAWEDCSSPESYTDLSDGMYLFEVRGTDQAGNVSDIESWDWEIDTSEPVITITEGPTNGSAISDDNPVLEFESDKPNTTFECRIGSPWFSENPGNMDWSPFVNCDSGEYEPGPLSDGKYTVEIVATDELGNSSTVRREFEIDTTAPDVTILTGPPEWSDSSNATFTFNSNEDPNVDYECRLDGGAWEDCSSPQNYFGLSEGEHIFEVRGTDQFGHESEIENWEWNIDTIAPDVTILTGPDFNSTSNNASFTFTSNEAPDVTYQCRLNSGSWVDCSSPRNYSNLQDGSYTFYVRAIDRAGNISPVDSYNWNIDTTAPVVQLLSHPAAVTNNPNAVFTFAADDVDATFECSIDNSAWTACTSPADYPGLSEGPHVFRVRATDPSGNVSNPVAWNWVIDQTKPIVQITSGPDGVVTFNSATFTFTGNESPMTYECSLDNGPWQSCATPRTYNNLSLGEHNFQVRGTDQAGNVSDPVTRSWEVQNLAPTVNITSGPGNGPNTSAEFRFVSNTPGAGFQCRLNNGNWTNCASPRRYNNLKYGQQRFQVRARNQQGIFSPVATWNWNVTDRGKCKISNVRSRFFIFTKRNAVRLVARYKASRPGAVRVRFFERTRNGKRGRFVGVTQTRFKRTGNRFMTFRVAQPRRANVMKRLRRSRHGFIANLTVLNSPGYCKRIFNTDLQLTVKRRVQGQNVWFQRGSFGRQ